MTKRELLKKIKMELWVTEKVGIPKDCKITSPAVRNRHVPMHLTVGDLLAIKRALESKPRTRVHQ